MSEMLSLTGPSMPILNLHMAGIFEMILLLVAALCSSVRRALFFVGCQSLAVILSNKPVPMNSAEVYVDSSLSLKNLKSSLEAV